jgi:hypothetical protein
MGSNTGREYAISLDQNDALKKTRDEFVIPSVAEISSSRLRDAGKATNDPGQEGTVMYDD